MSGQRRRPLDDFDDYESGRRNKRQRMSGDYQTEFDAEVPLEELIYRCTDRNTLSSVETNLESLVSVLERNLNTDRIKILRILTECAINMPERCTLFTTLVGLLNAKNYKFGGEFVDYMVKAFKEALKNCEWDAARYLLRFLADLVNCHVISAPSILQLFQTMMAAANDDTTPQVRRDWFVFAIMSTLPWVGRDLYEKNEKLLDDLVTAIEVYLNKRSKKHHNLLRVWTSDTPHPQEEYLDCLWAQIRKLRQDNWTEKHIPRPYLAFDATLCEALQHNLPQIAAPPHQESCEYPIPWVVYRMFDYTDCPEGPVLPGSHSIERFLIEEHLHRIIEKYHQERKECAAQLLAAPFKNKIPLEYCIVEVIFGELFHMPTPRYLEIAYGSILIELCKLQPSTLPQVLAQATEILFMRIDSMNTSCFDRFVNWFSYHLSNFKFTWSWDEWDSCLLLHPEHPRPKFIQEVLLQSLRLSYYERIEGMMCQKDNTYKDLLPPKPLPDYKYAKEDATDVPETSISVAHQLVVAIRRKCTPEEVLSILSEIPGPDLDDLDHNPARIDVFIQTLLNLGSKSFSHSFAAITKFFSVIKKLVRTEEAQIHMLHNIFELWKNHQQMLVVIIDKMLKLQLVDCSSVATWIFSREMVEEFTKMYLWEILHLTIKKMNRHVISLTNDVNVAKEKLAKTDDSSASESEDEDGIRQKRQKPEKTTEEFVERMEEKLETANVEQKRLFLIIFQRFIMILAEHLLRADRDGIDPETHWYRWTSGRLQQVFLLHHDQVQKYTKTLETLLFTSDLDTRVLTIFQQFVALRDKKNDQDQGE